MPGRLREFRRTLRLSQAAFGKTFGGYNQSQISAYENGEVDVSLGLLLAIRAKGYPMEAVVGGSGKDVVHQTVTYLPAQYQTKLLTRRLAGVLVQLLDQDCQTVEAILHGFGIPVTDLTAQQQRLLDQRLQDPQETG
jgi:transcriptional regulator with XRE-family HTH domain